MLYNNKTKNKAKFWSKTRFYVGAKCKEMQKSVKYQRFTSQNEP